MHQKAWRTDGRTGGWTNNPEVICPSNLWSWGHNKPFGSGEEVKNRFSRWPPWQPSWISNQNDFSHFWSISHPDASYQVSSQLAFGFRRRSEKKIFKMATMEAILDFWSSWISDQNDLSYFLSTSHPHASYQFLSQLAFGFRRRCEK